MKIIYRDSLIERDCSQSRSQLDRLRYEIADMKKEHLLIFLVICLLFWGGCATPIAKLKNSVANGKAKDPIKISCCQKDIQITYLGTSGFLIERGDFAVLTAPFFSNPKITSILGPIYPKKEEIDRGLENTSLINVKAILVGHAHYDHLMDVPYVVKKIKEQNPVAKPKIYGSETMKNLLMNEERIEREIEAGREDPMDDPKTENIVSLNQKAAAFWSPGDWVCFDKEGEIACTGQNIIFRFMAINSEHAPHVAGFKFFSGIVDSTEGPPPKTGADWKEGQTFAYVMDFLDSSNAVDLRIHFQDATSNPPAGFLPVLKPVNRTDRVDIAIVCVAGYSQVKNYPEGIIRNLKPRHIIMSHWENFFKPLPKTDEELEVVPGTDVDEFIKRMERVMPEGVQWTLPAPGSKILYEGDYSQME